MLSFKKYTTYWNGNWMQFKGNHHFTWQREHFEPNSHKCFYLFCSPFKVRCLSLLTETKIHMATESKEDLFSFWSVGMNIRLFVYWKVFQNNWSDNCVDLSWPWPEFHLKFPQWHHFFRAQSWAPSQHGLYEYTDCGGVANVLLYTSKR